MSRVAYAFARLETEKLNLGLEHFVIQPMEQKKIYRVIKARTYFFHLPNIHLRLFMEHYICFWCRII